MYCSLVVLQYLACVLGAAASNVTITQMLDALHQLNVDWTFPRLIEIAQEVNYSGLAPDVVGRMDVTNTFIGSELNTEYTYGLFASLGQSNTTSLIGWPLNQTVTEVVIYGNTIAYSGIAQFNWTVEIVPAQFTFMIVFNEDLKVVQYDGQWVRGTWLFNYMLPKLAPRLARELGLPENTDPVRLATRRAALDICTVHETYCTGTKKQYKSHAQCMDFIENKRPFGELWQAGQDTGMCRYFHQAMVRYRPEVHCPHIGPSGGEMCISRDYVTEVSTNPFPVPFLSFPNDTTPV